MTWRDKFRPVIARVLQDNAGKLEKEVDAALLAKWRQIDGVCRYWPYRIWRDEIRRQREKLARLDGEVPRWKPERPKRKVRTMTSAAAKAWREEHQVPMFPTTSSK